MRFLYIKVLQILNQMVDLMLRIVGHVPRVSHVTGIFTQLWGRQCNWCPNANFDGERVPRVPRGIYASANVVHPSCEYYFGEIRIVFFCSKTKTCGIYLHDGKNLWTKKQTKI